MAGKISYISLSYSTVAESDKMTMVKYKLYSFDFMIIFNALKHSLFMIFGYSASYMCQFNRKWLLR
jgi:hypothetical protein